VAGLPDRTRLLDVVASLDAVDRRVHHGAFPTIYAQTPWCSTSPAVVLCEESHGGRAPSMPSHAYLLEVDVAAEVLEVWSSRRAGKPPSPEEATEALIHYAAHGAHQPLTCHHGGCGRAGEASCGPCSRSFCTRHAVVPGRAGGCLSCSPPRVVGPAHPAPTATTRPASVGVWATLPVLGVLGLVVGWLGSVPPLLVGGACLVVVGGCIGLGALVLRLMD